MAADIEIFGVEATLSAIGSDINDFNARVNSLIQHAGTNAEGTAIDLAAVDTGLMRASVAYTEGYMFSEVHDYVFYSVYVNFGTYKMAAQPFMTPAFEQESAKLKAGILAL